jgi:peptide/nickel transport system permease protein
MLVTIVIVTLIVFVLLRLSGDPVTILLSTEATQEEYDELRSALGLDKPIPVQFWRFIVELLSGGLKSTMYGAPALELVLERLPATFQLALSGITLTTLIGLPLGVLVAVRRGGWLDTWVISSALLLQSIPIFWLGMMLILLFAVQLRWLPTSGYGTWKHLVMPAVSVAAALSAQIMLLVRAGMLETLDKEYTRTARAKGLSGIAIVLRHALPNTLIPVVTVIGLYFGILMGGAVIIETVFSWPGVGQLAMAAIFNRDYAVVQSSVFVLAVAIVAVSFLVDLTYGVLDPRIRHE